MAKNNTHDETLLTSKFRSEIKAEIERRVEQMTEAYLRSKGIVCERCGLAHASIERAIRYHMARWWLMERNNDEAKAEWEFFEALRTALPPGVDVTVYRSQAEEILKENDG